jgi:hypothetical protein
MGTCFLGDAHVDDFAGKYIVCTQMESEALVGLECRSDRQATLIVAFLDHPDSF